MSASSEVDRRQVDRRQGDREVAPRQVLAALGDVLVLTEPHLIRLWKSSRLTFVQLRVLRRLRDRAASPGELAAAVGISTASMARTLARLEERGLIVRSIDPKDRRRIEVTLQPEGSRVLSVNRIWRGTAFERAAMSLDAEARRRLVDALGNLTETVQRELALLEETDRSAAINASREPRQTPMASGEGGRR